MPCCKACCRAALKETPRPAYAPVVEAVMEGRTAGNQINCCRAFSPLARKLCHTRAKSTSRSRCHSKSEPVRLMRALKASRLELS